MSSRLQSNLLLAVVLCFFMVTNSSLTCVRFTKILSIDSIHYFKPGQIWLASDNFRDNSIRLKLHDGEYTFSRDSAYPYSSYWADKDGKTFYRLIGVDPVALNDTSIIVTIKYELFDKKSKTNDSKVFNLKNYPVPLRMIKNFFVPVSEYNKIFPQRKSSSASTTG